MELIIVIAAVAAMVGLWWFSTRSTDKPAEPTEAAPKAPSTPKEVEQAVNSGLSQLGLPSVAELNKLTKKALDEKATADGIKLDRRQTKDKMIKAYRAELKKKS